LNDWNSLNLTGGAAAPQLQWTNRHWDLGNFG